MAGAQGQPERQIAGRRSDRQCNYAEPLAKAAGRRPLPGQQGPHASCLLLQALTIPEPPAPRPGGGRQGGREGLGRGQWRRNWAHGEQLVFLGSGEKAFYSPD